MNCQQINCKRWNKKSDELRKIIYQLYIKDSRLLMNIFFFKTNILNILSVIEIKRSIRVTFFKVYYVNVGEQLFKYIFSPFLQFVQFETQLKTLEM